MIAEISCFDSKAGVTFPATFEWDISCPYHLLLRLGNGDTFTANAGDFFESFCLIRERDLEPRGILLLCNGARRDVYPLGMSRSMSGARTASVLKMGQPTGADGLVIIFAPAPAELITTVREQREYFKQWLESLPRHDPHSEP